MEIRFAALGGPDVDAELLEQGVAAIAQKRADFEEVTSEVASGIETRGNVVHVDVGVHAIRIHPPWKGEHSAWCVAEVNGEGGVSMLVDIARTIAVHTKHSIRAVASGIERAAESGRMEIGYRALELAPDGTSNDLSFDEADEMCENEVDEDSLDELGDVLSVLVGDSAVHNAPRTSAALRCFRRKPMFEDDPRLGRLATAILAAKTVTFSSEGKERVRVSLEGNDGTKQISMVSDDEAARLRRATSR